MRIKKKELLEMIDQLIEINTLIDKDGSFPEGVDAPECQELAIKLGNFIEDKYKESNPKDIIHSLEDYCELIYQMSLFENEEQTKLHKLSKKVKAVLLSARQGIEYDLPKDRKQVVFLPYKVSMWDSLESIWMAAHRDPDVDDYVIPIPYFDRNPDGTFAKMHYEGDQYPDYVPITSWQEYSIPDEKPDVVFIHNPYDKNNYVTSVHPAFYSSELKKYTDCLVYVPYYVLGKVPPDDPDAIAGMTHMVTTDGVFNSDLTFVQDEDMEKIFVNELTKFFKENALTCDRRMLEDKIHGFGSPKYDRVLYMNDENTPVFDEWKKIINEKAPVLTIFLNTSVGALLRATGDEYFKKLLSFFELCKEKNFLPVWRPHPLTRSTLLSMRPGLIRVYDDILRTFLEEKTGILDLSPSMYAAMRISDIYYGDASSVEWLFRAAGKKVIRRGENGGKGHLVTKEVDEPVEDEFLEIEKSAEEKAVDKNKKFTDAGDTETVGKKIYDFTMSKVGA